jgi:hypothetical protein
MGFKGKLLRVIGRNEVETGTAPLDFGGNAKSHKQTDISQYETMRGLKHKINQLWAKLSIGKRSTTNSVNKAEHRYEEAERELSDMDCSSEDIQHHMLCAQVSVDALTVQKEVAAETRPSASTERVSALDSQLSKTQEMEAKPDSSSSQKYKSGTGDMETQAELALSYLSENNLPSDAVLSLEDGGTLPVNSETLSKCSEYFRFVWLLIPLIDM